MAMNQTLILLVTGNANKIIIIRNPVITDDLNLFH